MGIALLTFVDLLSPLQSLASRWMPVRRSRRAEAGTLACSDLRYVAVRPACAARGTPSGAAAGTPAARPLRVVRKEDAQHPGRRYAGRVVISGRMADVCAELDRLVALEAAEKSNGVQSLH